jgi:hypothetical protein
MLQPAEERRDDSRIGSQSWPWSMQYMYDTTHRHTALNIMCAEQPRPAARLPNRLPWPPDSSRPAPAGGSPTGVAS